MNDEQIKELVAAINNLAKAIAATASPKPKPKETKVDPEPKPKVKQQKVVDIEDTRSALVELAKKKGKTCAEDLLATFGASKIGDLKKDHSASRFTR